MTEQMNNEKDEILENSEELAEEITEQEIAESADEDDAVSEYNDVAAQVADLEDKLEEANEKYVRLFAEYDNFRKRTAREKSDTYANASAKCIENLLPVVDSYERSLEFECSDENFKNGMVMIFNQLKEFMAKMNVTSSDMALLVS